MLSSSPWKALASTVTGPLTSGFSVASDIMGSSNDGEKRKISKGTKVSGGTDGLSKIRKRKDWAARA
jgi:hypothetical protein